MSQANPTPEEASAYAAEFIRTGIKSTAFRAAFPDSKASSKVIDNKASLIHQTGEIQVRIGELQESSKKQTEKEFSISVADIKKTLATVIQKGIKDKNGTPINLSAVVSAAKELNLMDGNHADKSIDIKSSDGSMSPKDFNGFYDDEG